MAANIRKIIETVNESFARNNLDGFLAHCADDVQWAMVGDVHKQGIGAIREWSANMPAEAPRFTVTAIVTEGDHGVCYGDMTMKDEATGDLVPYSYCDIYRFRGDKIVELRSYVIKTATAAV